jgi:hypothetical protein
MTLLGSPKSWSCGIAARVAVNLCAKIELNIVELMVRPINALKRRKITSVPAARPVSSTRLTLAYNGIYITAKIIPVLIPTMTWRLYASA